MGKRRTGKERADWLREIQRESLRPDPFVHVGMTCGRCGAPDCIIVPNVAPDFKSLQGVGLTQHAMLCPEMCLERPWRCAGCEEPRFNPNGTPWHASDCEVEHPEVKAEWRKTLDIPTMRLTRMLAARGEFLPAFIMDALFPGFPHADPPSFAAFKAAGGAP